MSDEAFCIFRGIASSLAAEGEADSAVAIGKLWFYGVSLRCLFNPAQSVVELSSSGSALRRVKGGLL